MAKFQSGMSKRIERVYTTVLNITPLVRHGEMRRDTKR
jgi:hypothetical protein